MGQGRGVLMGQSGFQSGLDQEPAVHREPGLWIWAALGLSTLPFEGLGVVVDGGVFECHLMS